MASKPYSIVMSLFFASAALLLSSSVASGGLIEDVCTSTHEELVIDKKLCLDTLKSEPHIVAASNHLSIEIALLEVGMAHGNRTRSYLKKLLNRPGQNQDYKYVMQQCDLGYDTFGVSFRSALGEVREGDYETSSYDIMVAFTDNIDVCRKALKSKNVTDAVISKENDFIYVLGAVAFATVERL